ncbi:MULTISPECIES: energy-coupling factor transporter transmembrane component T family protein [Pelosinus]|uniref:ABC-type transporter, integral membrane subunit n=1 Tax=Pelosinus fermentans B4 TaxID=1149862 RepID=I9L7Y0_9FIRM|nr:MULTISPECIES: energy-coupling factor transporter transmembrane component T [Pelosinus]EIW16356.1 ABC-type transporter, integral membrane subunit [Pelosinus fermentans B4]EIW22664.1 ABC-type transporter, integral membrane subunit [Pelosinus fermentans A11]OAM95663.1 ABC-type transporter, integral membrane subunit [Pelosinus fermentans DSM 17108]SDR31270.1 energy-coupling factor transport system permease protein [Pelosinus fermentans]
MNDTIDFKASKPDPRVWMFLLVVISLLTFLCGSLLELFILFAALAVIMTWQKMLATVIYFVAFYTALLVLNEFLCLISIPPVSMVVGMLVLLLFRLMPVYMAYIILLEKTSINELIIALEQMHVPKILIIPLAVVYRYILTVKYEILYIKDSLKMRGLNPSLTGMFLQPVTTVEKFMIPLLIRSGKLADELSAAALCKGLDAEHPRTSCTGVRFEQKDAVCCVIFAVAAATLIFLHYYPGFGNLVL